MKGIVENMAADLEKKTGFPVSLSGLTSSLLSGKVAARSARVTNPAHYPVEDFLETGELEVRASAASLFGGGLKLRLLRVHIRSLTALRTSAGVTNLNEFRTAMENDARGGGEASDPEKSAARDFHIERLVVRIDTIRTEDHAGESLVKRDYALNWEREFADARDARILGNILLAALAEAGLTPEQCPVFASALPPELRAKLASV